LVVKLAAQEMGMNGPYHRQKAASLSEWRRQLSDIMSGLPAL
jgi:hypothetical protein